jgi:hypothetical protein
MTISGAPFRKILTMFLFYGCYTTVVAFLRFELKGMICKMFPSFSLILSKAFTPDSIRKFIKPYSVQLPSVLRFPPAIFSILAEQLNSTPSVMYYADFISLKPGVL